MKKTKFTLFHKNFLSDKIPLKIRALMLAIKILKENLQ